MEYEHLEEAIGKIDLLEYASKHYDFKRAGTDTYKCTCPLHSDPNPSLVITPSKGLFYCFSCGAGGTILNWLMTYEKLPFRDAVAKVGALAGIDITQRETSSALQVFREAEKNMAGTTKGEPVAHIILPDDTMEAYKDELPDEWIQEGISPEVMRKYGIRIDPRGNRIVYPVYDASGLLIGVKGRTRFPNYQAMRISKYMNYCKIGAVDYFMGLRENRPEIEATGKAIIFEGIKSGMKVEGWGYSWWLAAETSTLNNHQVDLLLKMHLKEITIAFDKDVPINKIRACTQRLRWFMDVYAVVDKWGLLDAKDSPCDKGRDVWERLYANRIKL